MSQISLISVADAHVVGPCILDSVPFHGFAFCHTVLVIILIIVLHIVGKCTAVHFVNSFSDLHTIYFFRIVNEVTFIVC